MSAPQSSDCPVDDELRAFIVGDVSTRRRSYLESHVLHCSRCETRLARFESSSDRLVDDLRQLHDTEEEAALPPDIRRRLLDASHRRPPSAQLHDLVTRVGFGPVDLGRFRIVEKIGEGSFGTVFRARDTELERDVALKVLRSRPRHALDQERRRREATSAAGLRHPNLVALYDIGETEDGLVYLATEFIDGPTLADVIRRGPIDAESAVAIVRRLTAAVAYAHGQGVVHRDIKPSNIILDHDGEPHLIDFGLAKTTGDDDVGGEGSDNFNDARSPRDDNDNDASRTPSSDIVGTPAYMSPEQARGDSAAIDGRSDVYGLGVVLYETTTGTRPFKGQGRMLLLQILEEEPIRPRLLNDEIPRDVEVVTLKAMAKSKARRYENADELEADLGRIASRDAIHARPQSPVEHLVRWCRRNPVAVGLLFAVTVGSTIGLFYLSRLTRTLVRDAAVVGAETKAEMLEEFNHYFSDLVDGLDSKHVTLSHEYAERPGTLPLPATFLTDGARRISERSEAGLEVRHYSDHPFPWRDDGGPHTDFERRALTRLRDTPDEAVFEFVERDGRPFLLHATARVMQPSCVECHNHHPRTPKADWQVGDVRGVLEIVYPMERDFDRVRTKLRGAFVLVGGVSLTLLALAIGSLGYRRRRTRRRVTPRR